MILQKLFDFSAWIYLTGVSFLIVRNNNYPWPLKRASDILFLCAITIALPWAWHIRKRLYHLQSCLQPLTLFASGISIATLIQVIIGNPISEGGAMEAFRVIEVLGLFILTGIYILVYGNSFIFRLFVAQLSTLLYSFIFLFPYETWINMYRFQLFENWPSNTSYYLIVSLLFLFSVLFMSWRDKIKIGVACAISIMLLMSFFLWTQTRASWLGLILATVILFGIWIFINLKVATYTGITIIAATILGFFLLPPITQGDIIHRVFPGIKLDSAHSRIQPEIKMEDHKSSPLINFEDPTRIELWNVYAERLFKNPWGYGVEYNPVNIGNGPQGPHNTLLEMMILGGFFSLAGFLQIFFVAIKNLRKQSVRDGRASIYRWSLLGSLLGLFVASLFDNLATFRLFWILLGAAFFFGKNEVVRNQET